MKQPKLYKTDLHFHPYENYYSIRVVKATSEKEAIEKIIYEDFDESNNICDKVLNKAELIKALFVQ